MRSPSTSSTEAGARAALAFTAALAVLLAAFLLGVGLGADSLPFPPEATFSDAVTAHWPNALLLRRAVLDEGALPLWQPGIFSGTPFAANPLSKVWYPPQWLVLLLPPALHLNVLIWLHLTLAGLGAWQWGRATGLARGPAALAGAGYALAPRLIAAVGSGHVDLAYAAAWVPWLLWAVERTLRADKVSGNRQNAPIPRPLPPAEPGEGERRLLDRPPSSSAGGGIEGGGVQRASPNLPRQQIARTPDGRGRAALALGAFAALCLLADVRLSAYAFALAAAYALWRGCPPIPGLSPTRDTVGELSTRRFRRGAALLRPVGAYRNTPLRRHFANSITREEGGTNGEQAGGLARAALRLLAAGLLAAGLSAVQWVPLLLWRADLSRAEITASDAALHSLQAGHWFGLLIGDHGGPGETLVYPGVSVLALALAALLLRPRAFAFWGVALLVIAAWAMGENFVLWPALVEIVPALRWLRVPPRAWLLAALILPYLAAWGAQLLVTQPPDRRAARLIVVGALGGGLACGLFSTLALSADLGWEAALGTFALPLTALIMLLALQRGAAFPRSVGAYGDTPLRRAAPLPERRDERGWPGSRALLAAFALIVLADLLWIGGSLVEGRSEREWLDPYRPLAEHLQEAGAVRVYSPTYSLPQQAAAYWGIARFDGVDPFQTRAYVEAAEAATGVRAEGYSVTIPAFVADSEEQTELETLATTNCDAPLRADLLGAWLVTHVVAACPLETEGLALEARIGEVYVYRNRYAPDARLIWDGPNRVTVTLRAPYAGPLYAVANGRWRAAPDDAPGLPGPLDGATNTWTFAYDPSEVWLVLGVGAALIALGGLALWGAGRHV